MVGVVTLRRGKTPSTNSWTIVAPLKRSKSSFCLVSDTHYLYCIGGLADDGFLSDVDRYDSKLNLWT